MRRKDTNRSVDEGRDEQRTYSCRPTVLASSESSDLSWPCNQLFEVIFNEVKCEQKEETAARGRLATEMRLFCPFC